MSLSCSEPQEKPKDTGVDSLSLLDLPDPGIELGSPELQANSLPTELSGKPMNNTGKSNFIDPEIGTSLLAE